MASSRKAVIAVAVAAIAWVVACGASETARDSDAPRPGTVAPVDASVDARTPGGGNGVDLPGEDEEGGGGEDSGAPVGAPGSGGGTILWMRTLADHSGPSVALNSNGTTALSSVVELVSDGSSLTLGTVEVSAFDPSGSLAWSLRAAGTKPRDFSDFNFTVEPWSSSFVLLDRPWRDMQTHALDFSCASHQTDPSARSRAMFLTQNGSCAREIDLGSSLVGFSADQAGNLWYSYTIPGCAGCLMPFAERDTSGELVLTRAYEAKSHAGGRLTRLGGVLYAWLDDISRVDDAFAPVWRADLPGWIVGSPFPGPQGEIAAVVARAFPDRAGGELSLVRVSPDGIVHAPVGLDASFTPAVVAGDSLGPLALSSSGEQELRLTAFGWDGSARWSRVLGRALGTASWLRLSAIAVDPSHGVRATGTFQGAVEIAGEPLDSGGRSAVFVIALER
jgi:hypothetical protein